MHHGLSRPHRRGASADTPRLVCEKTGEFVFQEETDHFENPCRSDGFICMIPVISERSQYSSLLYFWKDANSGLKMAGSGVPWSNFFNLCQTVKCYPKPHLFVPTVSLF